jgi:hypothetical protein
MLRRVGEKVELIPGENHWETQGYQVYRNGERMTEKLLHPEQSFELSGPGNYTAVAVEWSGLKSKPSLPLSIDSKTELAVLGESPSDFSWTSDRWVVGGNEVPAAEAQQADEAMREIVHIHDGVIHRENWQWGQLIARDDLNRDGLATRRLFYDDGKLTRREYHNRQGKYVSTEHFDAEGFHARTEQFVLYNKPAGFKRTWWYHRGMPQKCLYQTPQGTTIYQRIDDETWSAIHPSD